MEIEARLQKAAFLGDLDRLRHLIAQGSDLEEWDNNGQTALHNAIENLHTNVIEVLISAGASVERETSGGWSPLIHALDIETDSASQRHQSEPGTDILQLLIKHGADVNRRCSWGLRPVDFARKVHNRVAEEILINAGAKDGIH